MLTEKQFLEKYPPLQVESDEGSYMFDDFERAKRFDREGYQVFTIVDDGGETENWYAEPGFHVVNKLGYVVSENQLTPAEWDEWQGAIWFEADDVITAYDEAYSRLEEAINNELNGMTADQLRQFVYEYLYELHRKTDENQELIDYVATQLPDFDPEDYAE